MKQKKRNRTKQTLPARAGGSPGRDGRKSAAKIYRVVAANPSRQGKYE
jgi:hypothetical protein